MIKFVLPCPSMTFKWISIQSFHSRDAPKPVICYAPYLESSWVKYITYLRYLHKTAQKNLLIVRSCTNATSVDEYLRMNGMEIK